MNKMTMRNVGIVFSPTLGIPAGVLSLMLGEFNRVFNVDAGKGLMDGGEETISGNLAVDDALRRNSRQYFDTAADQILGLVGRSLNGMFLFILCRRKLSFGEKRDFIDRLCSRGGRVRLHVLRCLLNFFF